MVPFLIIWTGQAFSLLGSRLLRLALVWWLTKTTGSVRVLAFATMMALLPQIFRSRRRARWLTVGTGAP